MTNKDYRDDQTRGPIDRRAIEQEILRRTATAQRQRNRARKTLRYSPLYKDLMALSYFNDRRAEQLRAKL